MRLFAWELWKLSMLPPKGVAAALARKSAVGRPRTGPKNSFKDKSFSFYADFPNTQDLTAARESLERRIFDQIMLDIFNVTVANW